MLDLLKKTLLTGIGLTLLTKDRVEELARDIAAQANMSADKGQAFVDEAVARARQGRTELEGTIQRFVGEALRRADCAAQRDLGALEARVAELERRLAEKPAS
jgi:polyhydroxyalkanoate synthesis regulator phasin